VAICGHSISCQSDALEAAGWEVAVARIAMQHDHQPGGGEQSALAPGCASHAATYHHFRPELVAHIQPGQAAWVRCWTRGGKRSTTYIRAEVLSVEADERTISLRTRKGDMTVPLHDCINSATFAEEQSRDVMHFKLNLPESAKYATLHELLNSRPPPLAVQGDSGRIF
jgi:hypothetical protein